VHLLETFAGRKALSITSEEVEEYLDARIAAGAAVATANREGACLRHMFRLALRKKILPKWSTPEIELRPEDNIREGFLEPADLDAFLTALRGRDPVIADLAELAFLTLMRRGNVLGLIWPMLDLTSKPATSSAARSRSPARRRRTSGRSPCRSRVGSSASSTAGGRPGPRPAPTCSTAPGTRSVASTARGSPPPR
jgi:hypothetical protein